MRLIRTTTPLNTRDSHPPEEEVRPAFHKSAAAQPGHNEDTGHQGRKLLRQWPAKMEHKAALQHNELLSRISQVAPWTNMQYDVSGLHTK